MAVLVEGISVVIRCRAILEKYVGGQEAFVAELPNDSLCADGELAALSFMTPTSVQAYVGLLEQRGLRYVDDHQAVDLVVVDQNTGLRAGCAWAAFGHSFLNDHPERKISICIHEPTVVDQVVLPHNWSYEHSLYAAGVHVPEQLPEHFKHARREHGHDVYVDQRTGEEYVVRH